MSFLPIVDRELRVAARRRTTYRTRTWFVLATSAFSALLLLAGDFASTTRVGGPVFWSLAWIAFAFCLLAGPRYAADSLSEEKREGTIGLLLLTDLRGYDLVLGKLISVSAQTVQGLLAFVPVLSVSLLLGGVTAGEFWRTTCVLLNALFASLSMGLLVSSVSRQAHRAIVATVLVLGIQFLVPFAIHTVLPRAWSRGLSAAGLIDPLAPLNAAADLAYAPDPNRFWMSLCANHLFAWCSLLFASLALPHSWQDRRAPGGGSFARIRSATTPRQSEERARRRARLLERNPICWLASRDEAQRWLLWVFAAAVVSSGVVVFILELTVGHTFGVDYVLAVALGVVLKLWVGWQACATLAEARRNGAVELLLATPLAVEAIIRGHWQALQRFFLWPALGALLLSALPVLQSLIRSNPSAGSLLVFPFPAMIVFRGATLILDLLAIAWVGMWMGLTQPKPVQAFFRTVLMTILLPVLVFCLPNMVLDLFWIGWARRRLEHQFREAAANLHAPVSLEPGRSAPALASPPVIAQVAPSRSNDYSH